MEGVNGVETKVFHAYSVEEATAPPLPPEEETQEARVLKAGESVPLSNIKFKPINHSYSRALTSPLELIKRAGHGNPIKNVNQYWRDSMRRGIGSFINTAV